LTAANSPNRPSAIDQLPEMGPPTLHPPPLLLPPLALPPVLVGPLPPVLLPPAPVPLAPAAPPLLPAEPAPGASLGFVKVQKGAMHFAPSAAHLQSESTVHHPSLPLGWEPWALQVSNGAVA
jgi:hypothetical protein